MNIPLKKKKKKKEKEGRCPYFTFFLNSIARIIFLNESPTSLYKKMQFLSSSVITRLARRNRVPEGDNNQLMIVIYNKNSDIPFS